MEKKFSKLFAFDLDGTLVHDRPGGKREIPETLLKAVRELAQKAYILVATGRRFRSSMPVLEVMPSMQFGVFHNGLIVRKSDGGIVVRKKILAEEINVVSSLLRAMRQVPIVVLDGQRGDYDFAFEREVTFRDRHATYAWQRAREHALLVDHFDELIPEYSDHLLEVACIGDYYKLIEVQRELEAALPDRLRAIVVRNCGYEGRSVLEVFDRQASKRSGVEYVKNLLQVDQVIAVGDDENDMEMLEWSDISVSMGHALPHIKAKAQLEVDGPEGLEKFLRENWLK